MRHLIILILLTYSSLLVSCNDTELSPSMVGLIQGICGVAKENINAQGATAERIQKFPDDMEEKLRKSLEMLGMSYKIASAIFEAVTKVATKENYDKVCNNSDVSPGVARRFLDDRQNPGTKSHIKQTDTEIELTTENTNETEGSIQNRPNERTYISKPLSAVPKHLHKPVTIYSVLEKIEKIIKRSVNDNMTIEEKLAKANTVKNQLLEAFRRAYKDSDKLTNYLTVVEHGINSAMEKVIINSIQTRRDDAIEIGEEANTEEAAEPNQLKTNESSNTHFVKFVPLSRDSTSTTHFPVVTKPYGCKDILKDTCVNLRTLDKFICDYNGTQYEMHQICDGNVDCADGSDEKNCIQQVIGKIHKASQVMAKVEMSQNCFKSIIDKSLITQQGQILSKLLKMQVDFLDQLTQRGHPSSTPGENNLKKKTSNQTITGLAYEVAAVVRTFADTLVTSICYIDDKLSAASNNKVGQDLDKEIEQLEIEVQTAWLPSSCKCNGEYCANRTNCHPGCKVYCFQVFKLKNFDCKTNKGHSGVPLDLVCDGKLDCLDQMDEINCTTDIVASKFESRKMFVQLIDTVKTKSLTKVFTPVYTGMAELVARIQKLQRRSDTHPINIELLKLAREKCYLKIVNIFDTVLEKKDLSKEQLEEIYDFLLMTNVNLVTALKHTHLGNKKITPDDCVCDEAACVQVKCRDHCVRYCAAQTLFVKYSCSSSAGNVSIPMDSICDGKRNCPNGEDELSCKKDVCRIHHLKLLRHNIEALCERNRGGAVGVVLDEWKPKVLTNLSALETHERLTLGVWKNAVTGLLNALVKSYANLKPTRRQDTDMMRVKKLFKFSQLILEMVKECSK